MNQAELVAAVTEKTDLSKKQTETLLKIVGDVVTDALVNGDEVTFPGLGKLSVKETAARKGRNPATGAEINIPAKKAPKFSAAKALKDALNG